MGSEYELAVLAEVNNTGKKVHSDSKDKNLTKNVKRLNTKIQKNTQHQIIFAILFSTPQCVGLC